MPKRKGRTVEPTDELGEDGWLKALELDEYAVRSQNGPESIQEVLFSYLETLQTHIARVRSPRLNRGTLCCTERHNY